MLHGNSLVEYVVHVGAVAHPYVESFFSPYDLGIQMEIGVLPKMFEQEVSATLGFALFSDKRDSALHNALLHYGHIDE